VEHRVISNIFQFEYSKDGLEKWSRFAAGLEEINSSGTSQLHSAWHDEKEFTLFMANPAFRRDSSRDSRERPSLMRSSVRSFQQGRLLGQAWRAIIFMFFVVLHPFSKYRVLWDFVGMAVCFHDVTMLPAQVFELPEGYLAFRSFWEWIFCAFWTIDILLNFSTGFISSEGLLEMRKDKVAEQYIRSWFVPDLVITVVDWTSLIMSTGNSEVLRLGTRSLRALRILRMARLNASVNQIMGAKSSESMNIIAGLVKFLLILILVTHYVACVWYWLADTEDQVLTWRDEFLHVGDSDVYGYFTAMHWALTQFTPASMEVVPMNVSERVYTCIVIIVAMVVFSSFVSSITQAMTLLRSTRARKVEQELLMRKYFSEFRIPRELAARCKHFMLQHQRIANKRIKESEIPCMLTLPKAIREELRYEAFTPWLKKHPFFESYMELCPAGMRQICVSATDEVSMLPLEDLFWNGQTVNRMFFVRVGFVAYCHRNHMILPLEVTPGQWACEETLWSKASLVDGPFRASPVGCELIAVLPQEFHTIARAYPGPLRFCAGYAEAFVKEFNTASKKTECDDLLFNNHGTIMNLVEDSCVGDDIWDKLKQRLGGEAKKKNVRASSSSPGGQNWKVSTGSKKLVRAYTKPLAPTEGKEDPVQEISVKPSRNTVGEFQSPKRSQSSPTVGADTASGSTIRRSV
jgi:hypothetical protein